MRRGRSLVWDGSDSRNSAVGCSTSESNADADPTTISKSRGRGGLRFLDDHLLELATGKEQKTYPHPNVTRGGIVVPHVITLCRPIVSINGISHRLKRRGGLGWRLPIPHYCINDGTRRVADGKTHFVVRRQSIAVETVAVVSDACTESGRRIRYKVDIVVSVQEYSSEQSISGGQGTLGSIELTSVTLTAANVL